MTNESLRMYFTRGTVRGTNSVVLAGHLYEFEDERVTRLISLRDGEWEQLADLPEIVAALATVPESGVATVYALLRTGVVHRWAGDAHSTEVIDNERGLFFSELREIGGDLYACGAGLQVFRRLAGRWEAIDEGVFVGEQRPMRILTSIDGYSEREIFSAGTGGVICHFDGYLWSRIESPTNLGLTKVLCTPAGVFICGYKGLLMKGRIDGWDLIKQEDEKAPLTDLAWGFGRLFVASEYWLAEFEGSSLTLVEPPVPGELAFGSLCVGEGEMWSIGGECVLRYDGASWESHRFPWNEA
jgi:hypothetical protein